MQLKRENSLKNISALFTTFENSVTLQNSIGYTDINKTAERLFITVLNYIYGYNLTDLNEIQKNYPAIDLGDKSRRVCVQVTSESSSSKFKDTISKFKEKNLEQHYDYLIFLIISNKKICSAPTCDVVDVAVINLTNLYNDLANCDDNYIYGLEKYLNDNLRTMGNTSNSILPINRSVSSVSSSFDDFIRFAGYGDTEYEDLLYKDLRELERILSSLTENQREYLYYIIDEGMFEETGRGFINKEKVVITANDLEHKFGNVGVQIYTVLSSKKLLYLDDEYDFTGDGRYISVIIPYFSKYIDGNLLPIIKDYCESQRRNLYRLIIDCDFSVLD